MSKHALSSLDVSPSISCAPPWGPRAISIHIDTALSQRRHHRYRRHQLGPYHSRSIDSSKHAKVLLRQRMNAGDKFHVSLSLWCNTLPFEVACEYCHLSVVVSLKTLFSCISRLVPVFFFLLLPFYEHLVFLARVPAASLIQAMQERLAKSQLPSTNARRSRLKCWSWHDDKSSPVPRKKRGHPQRGFQLLITGWTAAGMIGPSQAT